MTHPTPDPLRETDVPHMHPMEVMARNFRAKQRAALAAPQPAPDKLRENLGKALECELRELLRTKEAPYMDLAEACQSAARAALAAAPQPASDPLREAAQAVLDCWDSRNWKAAPTADYMRRLRAALAPDAVALGQALYDAVHYAAERGDLDNMDIVLRPLWEWHVAFVEPGTAIPEDIKTPPFEASAEFPEIPDTSEQRSFIAGWNAAMKQESDSVKYWRERALKAEADVQFLNAQIKGQDALIEELRKINDIL